MARRAVCAGKRSAPTALSVSSSESISLLASKDFGHEKGLGRVLTFLDPLLVVNCQPFLDLFPSFRNREERRSQPKGVRK